MSLTSPGVEVTIIDQSQYLPAPTNSVPFVLVATAQNKANASGTGIAEATTAANANKLYQVTSQRDLVNLYGTPFFYTTATGTPIQGYELNEYGLLAAYSLLGATNRCYVLRANIDLASLVGQTGRPTGSPEANSWWLDTTTTNWGVFEFNATTGKFTQQTPLVITDSGNLSGGKPLDSLGNIGDYAIVALQITGTPTATSSRQYFFKSLDNTWIQVGSNEWKQNWPTVQGSNSNPTLGTGTFVINVGGEWSTTISITSGDDVDDVVADINNLDYSVITAENRDGKLCLFATNTGSENDYIVISAGTGVNVLSQLGITAGTYYQPGFVQGTAAQMPLWTTSQAQPRPTGSVWVKVGSAGNGFYPIIAQYNELTASWSYKTPTLAASDWAATDSLDSTGGQTIPAGTVYAQYGFDSEYVKSPMYLWQRLATGPTVVTGTVSSPTIPAGTLRVQVSVPGSTSLSSEYTVTVGASSTATDFVTDWSAAGITNTTASVTTDGAVQLTHTRGGEIVINDFNPTTGVSAGILSAMGFVAGTTDGCKFGPSNDITYSDVATTKVSGGGDDNLTLDIQLSYGSYNVVAVNTGGAGYAVGDVIEVSGANIGGASPANDLTVAVTAVSTGAVTQVTLVSGTGVASYTTQLSNWVEFTYTANEGEPVAAPANNTNWFYSVVDEVDIMVNYNGNWKGYRNQAYDSNGFPTPTGSNTTDPNGPIISPTAPTLQSDGSALVYGDLWIDTTNLENYPVISRWQSVEGEDQWVLIDNTDQVNATGIVFADARWSSNQNTISPVDDPIPTISSLLTSNNLDLDAPSSSLYPTGMLLFNTRRSGYNVKQYRSNYFNNTNFPGESIPTQQDTWVSVSGLQSNGSPYMGRKAQRAMVVQAMRQAIDTNTDIRDEDNFFNLMATPNYPELQPNMVVLNADRGETGYIIGDTPMGLADDATQIQAWATNAAGATSTGEEGLVTRNTYLGLFYPSGIASDLSGNLVAVPASHMMLRTFLRNDSVAYPWLAAAGTRRGNIDNATNIGYLNRQTGEFQTIKTRLGIRDVLYINFINPLVFFTGVGLLNYGNKTSFNSQSALDRTNVARLVAYVRRQLTLAGRPFVFEPNDALTRNQISGVIETLMVDLVAKRGIYDYLVVCDESNNTPARIDRNELWVDVAIEPVKAAEFIYIPVRILNTGEISGI